MCTSTIPPRTICAWCPYTDETPARHLYGSIPLCPTCYRYATESDRATRERLSRPVVLPQKRVRWVA